MNNEPVAWMFVLDGCRNVTLDEDAADETRHNGIPLYTHPHPDNLGFALSIIDQQKLEIERLKAEIVAIEKNVDYWADKSAKTLTDEEILNCMGCLPKYNSEIVDDDLIEFARALLKKASEK